MEKFLVGVGCETFNHSTYIEDAMNGFAMQQTSFPYICCVVDDASTDGEPEVIRDYLGKHFDLDDKSVARHEETEDYVLCYARHKNNRNCYFVVVLLKYNHYSIKKTKEPYYDCYLKDIKYYALCEGDDYWTDSLKLQTQFDYMETHSYCSLCFHAHDDLYSNGSLKRIIPKSLKEFYAPQDIILIGNNVIGTNTIFYRRIYLEKEIIPKFWSDCPVGDIPTRLFFVSKGPIAYINKCMSVYRRDSLGGWTSRKVNFLQRTKHHLKIIAMFISYNNYTKRKYNSTICKEVFNIYMLIAKDAFHTLAKLIIPNPFVNYCKNEICALR